MFELNNINKTKSRRVILNNISGSTAGSLGVYGENGAGKSTLLRIMALIEHPTSGEVIYNGVNLTKNSLKYCHLIGYLPQNFIGFQNYTLEDNLHFLAYTKGIKNRRNRKKIILELLTELNLLSYKTIKLKNLSGGTLRRVGLCNALINEPEILILDEPTSGLDFKEQLRIRLVLSRLKEKGVKLIICSHILEDLAALTDNIITLKNGEINSFHVTNDVISTNLSVIEINTDQEGLTKYIKEGKLISFINNGSSFKVRLFSDKNSQPAFNKECNNTEKLQLILGSNEGIL